MFFSPTTFLFLGRYCNFFPCLGSSLKPRWKHCNEMQKTPDWESHRARFEHLLCLPLGSWRLISNLWICLCKHTMGKRRSFHKVIVEIDDITTDSCLGCRASTECPLPALLHFPFYAQSARLSCEYHLPSFLFYSWNQQSPDTYKVDFIAASGTCSVFTLVTYLHLLYLDWDDQDQILLCHIPAIGKTKFSKLQLSHPHNGPNLIGLAVRMNWNNAFK